MHDLTDIQQDFINKQFFNLTLFTLIFGVMFYDIINTLGFSYVDEICAVLLFLLFGYKVYHSKTWEFNKTFLFVMFVFIFYLFYSFAINSNTKGAIITDFIIQLKPYLAFFCVYAIHPKLTDNQRKIIREVVILCSLYIFAIGVIGLIEYEVIYFTFFHPSRLATASSILALLYLYCGDYSKIDKIAFIIILSLGILSGRSKHFGFFALCLLMILYFNKSFEMKLNVKNSVFLLIAIFFTVFVAWDKIEFYFITGGFGGQRETKDLYARMALYFFSTKIFMDYIPFGSGFASYATFASGEYYSPIYVKYGMEGMHGLTKASPDFIADTYYPALAQFGFAGAALFFLFWINLAVKAIKAYSKNCKKESILALMIVMFFLIECTSDSTITHNRGMFIMMLLGLIIRDIKNKTRHFQHEDSSSQ